MNTPTTSNMMSNATMMDLPAAKSGVLGKVDSLLGLLATMGNALQPLLALGLRWYVSWQFLKSGWLKATNWQQTVELFNSEYHVPLLPPTLAAVTGTFGELFFPVLLIVGLGGRIAPLGLFAVNAMAVISYSHVLFQEGFEAAVGQHVLWGLMLIVLAVYGQGAIALDRVLQPQPARKIW